MRKRLFCHLKINQLQLDLSSANFLNWAIGYRMKASKPRTRRRRSLSIRVRQWLRFAAKQRSAGRCTSLEEEMLRAVHIGNAAAARTGRGERRPKENRRRSDGRSRDSAVCHQTKALSRIGVAGLLVKGGTIKGQNGTCPAGRHPQNLAEDFLLKTDWLAG
jgi:hypothetical protein